MRVVRIITPLLASVSLASCGTYVPELQEIPGDVAGGQLLVQDIVNNVTCEIQDAINDVIRRDIEDVRSELFKERRTAWLDSWGVQMTLNLTVSEKGAVNPTVNWLPPSPPTAIFNLAGSATVSTEATRIDKMGSYYTRTRAGYARPVCFKQPTRRTFSASKRSQAEGMAAAQRAASRNGNCELPQQEKWSVQAGCNFSSSQVRGGNWRKRDSGMEADTRFDQPERRPVVCK